MAMRSPYGIFTGSSYLNSKLNFIDALNVLRYYWTGAAAALISSLLRKHRVRASLFRQPERLPEHLIRHQGSPLLLGEAGDEGGS